METSSSYQGFRVLRSLQVAFTLQCRRAGGRAGGPRVSMKERVHEPPPGGSGPGPVPFLVRSDFGGWTGGGADVAPRCGLASQPGGGWIDHPGGVQ